MRWRCRRRRLAGRTQAITLQLELDDQGVKTGFRDKRTRTQVHLFKLVSVYEVMKFRKSATKKLTSFPPSIKNLRRLNVTIENTAKTTMEIFIAPLGNVILGTAHDSVTAGARAFIILHFLAPCWWEPDQISVLCLNATRLFSWRSQNPKVSPWSIAWKHGILRYYQNGLKCMSVAVPGWLERLSFECLDGSHFVWRPDSNMPESSIRNLADAIVREYAVRDEARQQAKNAQKAKARNGCGPRRLHLAVPVALKWLKPVCYNAMLFCLHWGMFDELHKRTETFGRFGRGPKIERCDFMICLVGLFAHTFPPAGNGGRKSATGKPLFCADGKRRQRMVDDMKLAFRHYIEPSEFNAFFHQNRAALRRLESGIDLLDSHLDQVADRYAVFQGLGSDLQDYRQGLPDKIKALAVLRCDELDAALHAERLAARSRSLGKLSRQSRRR